MSNAKNRGPIVTYNADFPSLWKWALASSQQPSLQDCMVAEGAFGRATGRLSAPRYSRLLHKQKSIHGIDLM